MLKNTSGGCKKRFLLAAILGAFILILAFPLAVSATPAVTNLTMDRTTVNQGQSINISVRTTPQTNYVFAMVDGARAQGTRISTDAAGNHNWLITVTPTRSTNVIVFVNTLNSEAGAASFSVPVTVAGTAPVTPPEVPGTPPALGNLGPLDIASVVESPATAPGRVLLTVITGPQVNDVWVRFDANRYAVGTMTASDANSRTWTINFAPQNWVPQQVRIGANRSYSYTGATLRYFALTLAQPFVPPVGHMIQNVNAFPGEVAPGGNVTLTITTSAAAGAVWVRDVDGREINARSIAPNTVTTRTWEVTFPVSRTGTVTVFANATRSAVGAVQQTQVVTVRGQRAAILDASVNMTGGANNEALISVRTNRYVNYAWVVMNNQRFTLVPSHGFGAIGDRTWHLTVVGATVPVNVRVSEHHTGITIDAEGNINNFGPGQWWWSDPSWPGGQPPSGGQNQWPGGQWGTGNPGVLAVRHVSLPPWDQEIRRGGTVANRTVEFIVLTTDDVHEIRITGSNVQSSTSGVPWPSTLAGHREWLVSVTATTGIPLGWASFTVQALNEAGNEIGRGQTPTIHVRQN